MKRTRAITLCTTLSLGCAGAPMAPLADATLDVHTHDAAVTDAVDRRPSDVPSRCPNGVAQPYPDGASAPALLEALADLRFEAPGAPVALRDYYAPCAAEPRLLVLRTLTAWSGPSQHAAAHTSRVLAHPRASRFALVDLLALGPTNLPATTDDLSAWRARYDTTPAAVAIDPGYTFRSLYLSAGELPLVVFVDTRTMQVVSLLTRPSTQEMTEEITAVLTVMDGGTRPRPTPLTRVDNHFTPDEFEQLQAMALPTAPPPDPTNRVADDPRAARLGEALFNDTALSSSGMFSCASCHDPGRAFTDGHAVSTAAARGTRNAPTVLAAAYTRWLFWDGRADTAWSQALGPVENPVEMASSRLAVAHRIAARYASEYTALFGALPPLDDMTRFPPRGMPGDAAWEAMRADDREAVTRVFVNMGKSIAAYERAQRYPQAPIDRYVAGDRAALSEAQKTGLEDFLRLGCVQCHHGPLLTDDSFHDIGFPSGRTDSVPDRGRIDAVAQWMASPFHADGPYSDAPDRSRNGWIRDDASALGQFHTPSLRMVSRTGPWGHGGGFVMLEEVIRHYANGLLMPPLPSTTGTRDLHLPSFHMDATAITRLVAALSAFAP